MGSYLSEMAIKHPDWAIPFHHKQLICHSIHEGSAGIICIEQGCLVETMVFRHTPGSGKGACQLGDLVLHPPIMGYDKEAACIVSQYTFQAVHT